jgi:hypothetical protein
MTYLRLLVVAAAVAALAACGGSSSSSGPTVSIQPAKTFALDGFQPAGAVTAGKPTTLAFTIRQPDGQPLKNFKRGSGPHTGVHVIVVRDDLSSINHQHPPVAKSGRIAEQLTFPGPGNYRVVVDAYPNTTGPQRNFQLFHVVHVAGKEQPQPLPPYKPTDVVGGYRFTIHGKPNLKAIQAGFLTIDVTGPDGKPATFTPWFGALAHAIFFRKGSLDYFHTHVCAPNASGCASALGGATVSGKSSTPGKLQVGVLVPVAGTWRLFLQTQVNGHILTAPFTLKVR